MKTGPSSEHFLGSGRVTAEATEGFLEMSSLGNILGIPVNKNTYEKGLLFCKSRTHLGCWKWGTIGGKMMMQEPGARITEFTVFQAPCLEAESRTGNPGTDHGEFYLRAVLAS